MASTIPKTSYIPSDVPNVPSSIALDKRYEGHNYSLTDKSLPNDPKNYWTCLSRKGCGSVWSGEQGVSAAIPIITTRTGEKFTLMLLRYRWPLDTYGQWCLEWPAGMTTKDDHTVMDTVRRTLREKTGLGSEDARQKGFSDPELLFGLGSHATHPGTENTIKGSSIWHIKYDGETLDRSNLPQLVKPIPIYPGADTSFEPRIVVPFDKISACIQEYSDDPKFRVDAALCFSGHMIDDFIKAKYPNVGESDSDVGETTKWLKAKL